MHTPCTAQNPFSSHLPLRSSVRQGSAPRAHDSTTTPSAEHLSTTAQLSPTLTTSTLHRLLSTTSTPAQHKLFLARAQQSTPAPAQHNTTSRPTATQAPTRSCLSSHSADTPTSAAAPLPRRSCPNIKTSCSARLQRPQQQRHTAGHLHQPCLLRLR